MPRKREELPDNACGHVNKHSFGIDGKPDNMKCHLPKGHDGPHKGAHVRRVYDRKYVQKRLVDKTYKDVEEESEWLDGAGEYPTTFPAEIKPPSLAEQEFGVEAKIILGNG